MRVGTHVKQHSTGLEFDIVDKDLLYIPEDGTKLMYTLKMTGPGGGSILVVNEFTIGKHFHIVY